MKAEFTAIIEPAPEGGFWAICPEVPGANGQGETIEDAKNNLLFIKYQDRTEVLPWIKKMKSGIW